MGNYNKKVARDDINSGSAVVLWPMEGKGRRHKDQREVGGGGKIRKGGVTLSSFG